MFKIIDLSGLEADRIANNILAIGMETLTFEKVSQRFLEMMLGLEGVMSSFQDARSAYILSSELRDTDQDEVPQDEAKFHRYVCKQNLNINEEPREVLFSCHLQAAEDLRAIDEILAYIQSERKLLDEQKRIHSRLSPEDRYARNKLSFYQGRNETARTEIVNYISKGILGHARELCKVAPVTITLNAPDRFPMPYDYARSRYFRKVYDKYDPRTLTTVSNKFHSLPISAHIALKQLQKLDPKKYKEFARNYADGKTEYADTAVSIIQDLIDGNHILGKRKIALSKILSHYENQDFLSVVTMLPLQIEGIFHDICVTLDVDESEIDSASISRKIEIIDGKFRQLGSIEYYAFIFPVIRNAVAHGKLIEDDLEHTATILVLDLIPACEMACSDQLPVNKKIKLLSKGSDCAAHELVELLEVIDSPTPSFYELEEKEALVMTRFESEDFWSHMRDKLKAELRVHGDVAKPQIAKVVKKMQDRPIAPIQCKQFLSQLGPMMKEFSTEIGAETEREKSIMKLMGRLPFGGPRPFSRRPSK